MNNLSKKLIALALCAALCLGAAGVVFAKTGNAAAAQPLAAQSVPVQTTPEVSLPQSTYKDETVYVLTGADGAVQQIIVSDWLKNPENALSVSDISDLTDIETVKGDALFTQSGSSLTWQTQAEDVYYQGNSEKDPPVSMQVSYTLDGEPIEPQELIGKSGRVGIRFDCENRQYAQVEINGKQETVCVPFVMLTGLLLDSDSFCNVTVSNGTLLNDGDRTLVVGLAMPGLQQSLALPEDSDIFPESVQITADVTDFSLGVTVTLASNELFRALDSDASTEDGIALLSELTDGVTQLTDGSSALYDGLCTLLEEVGTLASGVDTLAQGASSLSAGAASVESGSAQLKSGLGELSSGLSSLSESSSDLTAAAESVFNSLLSTASAQLQTAGVPVSDLRIDTYAQTLDAVLAALGSDTTSPKAQTLLSLKASLDSYNSFYQGLCAYTGGVDSAAAGAASLSAGADALQSGAAQLSAGASAVYDGAATLQAAMPALTGGVTALQEGAKALSDGLQQINDQGISRLSALLGDDPAAFSARLQALADVCRAYRTFSGLPDGADGQVKFVFRTQELG